MVYVSRNLGICWNLLISFIRQEIPILQFIFFIKRHDVYLPYVGNTPPYTRCRPSCSFSWAYPTCHPRRRLQFLRWICELDQLIRRVQWASELSQRKDQDHTLKTSRNKGEGTEKSPYFILGELLHQFNWLWNSLSQRHQTI